MNINDCVVRITVEQLLDYIKCPNKFYIKYISRIRIPEETTTGDLVTRVINGYYAKLMEGKLPNIQNAKYKWDKLCEKYPKILTDKKVVEGFGLINQFDRYCYNKKLIIADFNSPYEITMTGNVILQGFFEALRLNNNNLEFFYADTSHTKPQQQLLDMSLKYTIQCYAMQKISPNYKTNCIRLFHLKSGQEFTTYRTKKDFDRLEKTVENVAKCIREKIYFPREDYTCPTCLCKNYCGYV